jgi:hypothetical protein
MGHDVQFWPRWDFPESGPNGDMKKTVEMKLLIIH